MNISPCLNPVCALATTDIEGATLSLLIMTVPGSAAPPIDTTTPDTVIMSMAPSSARASSTSVRAYFHSTTTPPSICPTSSIINHTPPHSTSSIYRTRSVSPYLLITSGLYQTALTEANSTRRVHISLDDIMSITGGSFILIVVMCVALVYMLGRKYRQRLYSVADIKNTGALTTVAHREEEISEDSQDLQLTTSNVNDGRAEEVPFLQVQVGAGYAEQLRNQQGPCNQHQRRSVSPLNISLFEYHHRSELDSASFHTTRASSSRPSSFPVRPLPLIPRSRPGSILTITTSPRLSPTPILTEFHRAAAEPGPSRRWTNAHAFHVEAHRRESRTGLSTAHSQSSIFSLPPPSYNSARLPSYQFPDEKVPLLPDQYRLGAGSGYGTHDPDDHLAT